MKHGKTQAALQLFDDTPGITAYEAAKRVGMVYPYAALYVALDKRERKHWPPCPLCGTRVRPQAPAPVKTVTMVIPK